LNSHLIFLFSFAIQKTSRSADPTMVPYSAVTFGRTLVPKRYFLVMNHDEREKYEH